MDEIKKRKKKKMIGAVISAIVIAFIVLIFIFMNISLMDSAEGYLWYMIVEIIILAVVFIGVIAALILRIREIKGGEEDDSSKY